jgi:hypothetical protein
VHGRHRHQPPPLLIGSALLEATALETDHLDQRPVPAMAKPYDKIVKLIRGKHIERERERILTLGERGGAGIPRRWLSPPPQPEACPYLEMPELDEKMRKEAGLDEKERKRGGS